jgi:ATP-dependent DNA ligase
VEAGRVVLRSRRGTDLAGMFPEIMAATAQMPDSTALDGVM